MRGGWVYIMSNRYRGTTHIGVTSYIAAYSFQHRTKAGSDFCRRHNLTRLVYADFAETIADAIAREKAMKKWRRAWKIEYRSRQSELARPVRDPQRRSRRESGVSAFAGMTGTGAVNSRTV